MKKIKMLLRLSILILFITALSVSASALHGDINGDDYLGIEDAVLALRFVSGIEAPTEEQERYSDLNYDGYLTTEDVRLVLRAAAGIDYLPDHYFSDWETVINPTCTQNGIALSYCVFCDKECEMILPAIPHTPVSATCTQGSYCSVCNEALSEPLTHKEKNGHCEYCGLLMHSPEITYKNKEIPYGCSEVRLGMILGTPKEILNDSFAQKPVTIYVYHTNYKDLGIFTFIDGELTQFFTNHSTAKVSQGSGTFSTSSASKITSLGDITITEYVDNLGNGKRYAFCGTVGQAYTLTFTDGYATIEKLVFHLTNGLRAINNVSALTYSHSVAAVAKKHSVDMATRHFFAHNNPDGLTLGNRLTAGGVSWSICCENIVAGYVDPYGVTNGWYNSESHRKNILNTKMKYLGVGFGYNENDTYKYYGTQNFYS